MDGDFAFAVDGTFQNSLCQFLGPLRVSNAVETRNSERTPKLGLTMFVCAAFCVSVCVNTPAVVRIFWMPKAKKLWECIILCPRETCTSDRVGTKFHLQILILRETENRDLSSVESFQPWPQQVLRLEFTKKTAWLCAMHFGPLAVATQKRLR